MGLVTDSIASFRSCGEHLGAMSHLAFLLFKVGDYQRSAGYYRNVIRLRKESTAAHFGLILCMKMMKGDDVVINHLIGKNDKISQT